MPTSDEKIGPHKPEWLKIRLHNDPRYADVAALVRRGDLHTICSSGRCPNISECWGRGTATFMIGGEICTRSCRFCATRSGRPLPLDLDEPMKLAHSVQTMGLVHCVVTSVDRDDLPDKGAEHWVRTVEAIRELNPQTTIELLIPDFDGDLRLLDRLLSGVLRAGAQVVGHNLETVRRLTPLVRSRARYELSLQVLKHISSDPGGSSPGNRSQAGGGLAKSGIMVGLGETRDEVLRTLDDLSDAGVRRLTIGQYLRPTRAHYPVAEYIHPDTFLDYRQEAVARGIVYTESGPLVRSSYRAERMAPKIPNASCPSSK